MHGVSAPKEMQRVRVDLALNCIGFISIKISFYCNLQILKKPYFSLNSAFNPLKLKIWIMLLIMGLLLMIIIMCNSCQNCELNVEKIKLMYSLLAETFQVNFFFTPTCVPSTSLLYKGCPDSRENKLFIKWMKLTFSKWGYQVCEMFEVNNINMT